MPQFAFRAIDEQSQAINGVLVADTERRVEQILQDRGLWLIDTKVEQQVEAKHRGSTVSRRDLADLFSSLAALLSAGIDLAECLNVLQMETPHAGLSNVLAALRLNVQSGVSFDEALGQHPTVFDTQLVNLIRAGTFSGRLVESCRDVAAHLEWTDNLVADVKQATTYPVLLLCAVLGLTVLMFTFVVPQFASIFSSLNLELPGLTKGVIAVGNVLTNYWWLLLLVAAAVVVGLRYGPNLHPPFGLVLDRLKLRLPLFGNLLGMLSQSRFAHNMSLMLSAGVPIVDALRLVGGVVDNRVLTQSIAEAEVAVIEGRKMSEALNRYKVFSPIVMRMIVVGEETGQLDECLGLVSKRFDVEIPRKIKQLFGVLEPAITLSLIGIVGLVAASIFLPLFTLMSGVTG